MNGSGRKKGIELRVVIPGASGFIGRNLLTRVPRNWNIVAMYNTDKSFPSFVDDLHSGNIASIKCNLLNVRDLRSFQRSCGTDYDLCIYLAANSDPSKSDVAPSSDLRSNAESLTNFLQFVKTRRLIFFSSGAVYGGLDGVVSPEMAVSPDLPYAISKLASEAYVRHFKRRGVIGEYLIVRFFGAYGSYESPRKIFTRLVEEFYFRHSREFSIRGNGLNLIDAMYVEDAVEGIFKMASAPLGDIVIDFCRGTPMNVRDLVLKAASIFGIADPKIIQQGETAEYNKFYANPVPFNQRYGFKPKTDLSNGLHRLAKFLEAGRN